MKKEVVIQEDRVKLRSYIFEFFPFECLLDLYKLAKDLSIDNNLKRDELIGILNHYHIPHDPVGPGTNRYTALVDGYIMKFCWDTDGMIDNLREFKYSVELQPCVLRVYECLPDGLIMVCEYVEVMDSDSFSRQEVKEEMLKILDKLGEQYYIGDIGIDIKNYTNWGFRKNLTRDLVVLDFAYCYSLSFKSFMCTCKPGAMLYYNEKYTHLICPYCDKSYTFADIRRRISRQEQEKEIGDIRDIGYVLHSKHEEHDFDPKKSIRYTVGESKKEKKQHFDRLKETEIDYDEPVEEEKVMEDEIDEDSMYEDINEHLPF